jgi:GH24 family phage-related lysozyme (muramidase)
MVKLSDLFKYYKHGTPHQMAAVSELEAELMKAAPQVFDRNQAWYKTWQAGGKLHNYDAAVKLIKEFEGVHLSAYPDPLHGWDVATIGYGTTRYPDGRKVQRGDKITVIDANQLLDVEVERIAEKLRSSVPFWGAMSGNKQCALISFAYNLGAGFYGSAGFETISKRLEGAQTGQQCRLQWSCTATQAPTLRLVCCGVVGQRAGCGLVSSSKDQPSSHLIARSHCALRRMCSSVNLRYGKRHGALTINIKSTLQPSWRHF